jgi:hypothetical protein
VLVAARYSWLDQLLQRLAPPSALGYFALPRWDDYQVAATLRLGRSETLSLYFLAADDRIDRTLDADDPARARSDVRTRSSYRVMIPYRREADGATTWATPFFGRDRSSYTTDFAGRPTRFDRDAWIIGARVGQARRLGRRLLLTVGVDLQGSRTRVARAGSLTLPPREGDLYVFGQPPGDDLLTDDFSALQIDAAPYAELELRHGPIVLTPGVRLDLGFVAGSHLTPPIPGAPTVGFQRLDAALDPRLSLRVRAHRRVAVTAACGLYHQPPDPADLSPVFGNPTLAPARALHVTAGLESRLTDALDLEVVGYYKQLDGLATRSPAPAPVVGALLLPEGTGTAYGGQLLLRQRPWRGLSGFVAYTVGRSERTDHPGGPTRLFDLDQTHGLTAVVSYALRGFLFGARLRYATGAPRTPVVGAFFDLRDDRYQPLFGAQNSVRLGDFMQVDLRVDRTFAWARAALDLYLEVQNVTARGNAEELLYSEDYTHRGTLTGLPTLAVLGAKVRF